MQFKKSKAFLASIIAAATVAASMLPNVASAERTRPETYGDSTYAERFMSLYDDVVTNGITNGYMSSQNSVDGATTATGMGVPFHSVETLNIEAPDYGHETTSEALSYLVWVAAMRDNIVNAVNNGETTITNLEAGSQQIGDLASAWKVMEATMIPDIQPSYMSGNNTSATYSDEWPQVEDYPTDMDQGKKVGNAIHSYFTQAYGSDSGLYLMNWLADVDDWYGFGAANGDQYGQSAVNGPFTLINTFQRGEQESCWETIPFASVDLHYGNQGGNQGHALQPYGWGGNNGMKGFFNTEASPAEQWSYTNAPDAEDRAIQAVYDAERWGVADQQVQSKWGGSQAITSLAAKMGDEARNNMYDKYYQEIGIGYTVNGGGGLNSFQSTGNGGSSAETGKHYLMNWYTSWGGALDGSWNWQIGASHMHEFYQNPLTAYALAYDSTLSSAMRAQNAVSDYQTSLERQMEFYLWLSSVDGPIAGGATNSWGGQYQTYGDEHSTFYGMAYVEHPVYADPGSNHWIGNQVWAVQRLAELYYQITQVEPSNATIQIAQTGMTLQQALETVLDKWVGWFLDYTILGEATETTTVTHRYEPYDLEESTYEVPVASSAVDDGVNFSIPSSLVWDGEPEKWTGQYQENSNLVSTIVAYGNGDPGCISSLANTLIYYAKARGADASQMDAYKTSYDETVHSTTSARDIDDADRAGQALYLAQQLLDREWAMMRDDIGLGIADHNTNLVRLWDTTGEAYGQPTRVVLPNGTSQNGDGQVLSADRYSGNMPNGDRIEDGVSFVSIRSNYEDDEMYQTALQYYTDSGNTSTEDYYFTLHRFWHEGDVLMALGSMYELYPDLTPTNVDDSEQGELTLTISPTEVAVGESATVTGTVDGQTVDVTVTVDDTTVATADGNTVTGVAPGTVTVTGTYTAADGTTVTGTATLTVTEAATTTTEATTTESSETTTTTTSSSSSSNGELIFGVLGDIDLDGDVDLADTVLLEQYIAQYTTLTEDQLANADTNADGEVGNDLDGVSLLRHNTGEIESLPDTSEQ